MAANTPILKSISTGSQFQAFYMTLMIYSGAPSCPFYERTNISKFLKLFENMCDTYQMDASEKIRHLFWYCKMFTTYYIRFVIGFS